MKAHPTARRSILRALSTALGIFAILLLSGCLPPVDVNVATPEPIKVDLNMDVNVYQHTTAAATKTPEQAKADSDFRQAMDRRHNRMSEIQDLKNNRLVGENHSGLLSVRNRPAGDYGDYVEKTVSEENSDREILMKHEAEEKDVSIDKIREDRWVHWQRKSFPGEWIEVADGNKFRWEQKQNLSSDEKPSSPDPAPAP